MPGYVAIGGDWEGFGGSGSCVCWWDYCWFCVGGGHFVGNTFGRVFKFCRCSCEVDKVNSLNMDWNGYDVSV